MQVNVWTVTAAAAVTCLATGLGALPFLFVRNGMTKDWLGVSNAIASGFMLAASVGLLWQGWPLGVGRLGLGALAGAVFIFGFRRLLGAGDDIVLGRLTGVDARKALVIIAVMTAHSATEGVGVGVLLWDSQKLGLLITLAIAIHNIPGRSCDQPCPRSAGSDGDVRGRLECLLQPAAAAHRSISSWSSSSHSCPSASALRPGR